jgi:hypothetical protein
MMSALRLVTSTTTSTYLVGRTGGAPGSVIHTLHGGAADEDHFGQQVAERRGRGSSS